jgi:hypothetical protein
MLIGLSLFPVYLELRRSRPWKRVTELKKAAVRDRDKAGGRAPMSPAGD